MKFTHFAFLSGPLVCAPCGIAQIPTPAPSVVQLDPVVITGSNIPTAADAIAVPVTIIGQREIEQTGLDANLLDILRKRLPQIAGSYSLGNSNANTGVNATMGGSTPGLRNLPVLVLLNGRRIATSGANAAVGRDFVDLNQIPSAAVERIEVLTDGASAIYGSDAMAGVINIILKSDYHSAEAGGRFAFASGGGRYTERSGYFVAGGGNRTVHVTASLSWSKTDPLFQNERDFSRNIAGLSATISGTVGSGGPPPTHLLNPALASPSQRNPVGPAATATSFAQLVANGTYLPTTFAAVAGAFNATPYVTLLVGQEQRSGSVNTRINLPRTPLSLFGDYLHTETRSFSQLAANPITVTLASGWPSNPLTGPFPTAGFRYLPAPRQFIHQSRLNRATFGVRGSLDGDWSWEIARTWNENHLARSQTGVLYSPNFNRAIAGGFNQLGQAVAGGAFSRVVTGFSESSNAFVIQPALDPLARPEGVNPASLANVLGVSHGNFDSRLNTVDAKLSGHALALPGGRIGWALGGEIRRDQLVGAPDENTRRTGPTAARWLGTTVYDPFFASRRVNVAFLEVRAPVFGEGWSLPGLRALDLTAARRIDRYSDVGRSVVPKYGVRWQPFTPELVVRATYSESFTAFPFSLLYGPQTLTTTATTVLPALFGVNGQAQAITGANPDLKPYRTKTHAFGVVLSPRALKGLTLSADYSDIDFRNHEGQVGPIPILQSVNDLGPASPYAGQIAFFAFPGRPGARAVSRPGEIADFLRAGNSASNLFISDTLINFAAQHVQSLDVNADYALPGDHHGRWRFSTAGSFFLHYRFNARPEQPFYEYAGVVSTGGSGSQATIPGYRFHSTAVWSKGAWEWMLAHNYISAVTDIGPGGVTFATSTAWRRVPVASYSTWDLQGAVELEQLAPTVWSHRLKGVRLSLGVNNLGHRAPPPAPQSYPDTASDLSLYSPIGRMFFMKLRTKF